MSAPCFRLAATIRTATHGSGGFGSTGKTTTLEGRAKTEDAARAAILAAWHDTLAAMALQSIPDPNSKGQSDD
jgi:hypothetical protein